VAGGYYGRSVTFVGWLRRIGGDEYELVPGHITVWRKSGSFDFNGLDTLAAEGLGKDYSASEPSKGIEQIHRLLVRRPKPCVEASWKKQVPKPKGWRDDE
jgi:hypothetical protein